MTARYFLILFAAISVTLGVLYIKERQRSPIEIVREVEVPRILTKEVPVEKIVEVIKEVPVEVIHQIEKPLTEAQLAAIDFASRVASSRLVSKKEDILAGTESVRVMIILGDEIRELVRENLVRNRFELILRRNGIKIDLESSDIAFLTLSGFWNDEKHIQMTYSYQYGIRGMVNMARGGEFRFLDVDLWKDGGFGFSGSQKIKDSLMQNTETAAEAIANTLLSANQ